MPQVVYTPECRENQLTRFRAFVKSAYGITLSDYWELHKWSIDNYPAFWDCVWKFFEIKHSQPYTQVLERTGGFLKPEWFKGLRFNSAENILKYRDDHVAIIATDGDDNTVSVTYEELRQQVSAYYAALVSLGVEKGDCIACFMQNKREAVFAFLATAALGCVWSTALPFLGDKATVARLSQVKPKVLFTGGNFHYFGKEIRMDLKIPAVANEISSLLQTVFVPSKLSQQVPNCDNCVSVDEFLAGSAAHPLSFQQVDFEYPLQISFTSGTTGKPKSLVHSHGSFLASLRDYGLQGDGDRDSVFLCFSPVGWISWNMFVNTLHLGATLLLYDGDPADRGPTGYWDVLDKFGVTFAYVFSSTIELMEIHGNHPTEKHKLSRLKEIHPMGSPAKPHTFNYLTEVVKTNIFCSPIYGCTEMLGCMSGLDSNLPVYKGEIQAPGLAMDIKILDETGTSVLGEKGDLVIANPYPGMPVCFLHDPDALQELYLEKHPGYFDVGDEAWINPVTKGLVVYGRSDDTMNPGGARFNAPEIYFALEGFPGLVDSLCTSQLNLQLDERVVLFVRLNDGLVLTADIEQQLRSRIERELTIEHVPQIILQAPELPYNLTGKKLHGIVKKILNKKSFENVDIVSNPSSLEYFKSLDLGDF